MADYLKCNVNVWGTVGMGEIVGKVYSPMGLRDFGDMGLFIHFSPLHGRHGIINISDRVARTVLVLHKGHTQSRLPSSLVHSGS